MYNNINSFIKAIIQQEYSVFTSHRELRKGESAALVVGEVRLSSRSEEMQTRFPR